MSGGVVMVSASFHPHLGGAEKQALELSAALKAKGVPVVVATRRLPGLSAEETVRGVPVRRLGSAGPVSFLFSLSAFLIARRKDYTAIHVHLAGSPALASAFVGRLLGKRVVVKLGGGAGIGELAASARTLPGRLKLRLLALLRPKLTAVAAELAEEARRYLGNVEVEVLPNGVDAARYAPAASPERKADLRRALGWPANAVIFLYAGRLSPEKRLPAFAQAWIRASRRVARPAFLAFVGAGPEEPAMRLVVDTLKARDLVKIHAPFDKLEDAYAAADVFVLPSISEGLSNALLEAMAAGLPVLGSRVGGTAETVVEGETGFLFAPKDEAELAAKLDRVFAEPDLPRLGAAARRRAEKDFSLDVVVERWRGLYGLA